MNFRKFDVSFHSFKLASEPCSSVTYCPSFLNICKNNIAYGIELNNSCDDWWLHKIAPSETQNGNALILENATNMNFARKKLENEIKYIK